MLHEIIHHLEKPSLYQKSKVPFWNDEHISAEMLKAHLDPDFDGASRKLDFIENSVLWINRRIPPQNDSSILDLGCGPGIYAERFAQCGYQVTGVDFSKRSIHYAREEAQRKKLDITYLYQNYLEMELERSFDFVTMIYCDYGALSTEDRHTVMQKAYGLLRPGGKFLLDVFSMARYASFQERQTWEICRNGGFWRKDSYIAVNRYCKYPDRVSLDQTAVISEDGIISYYIWNTYFTKETLTAEAEESGFHVCDVYGDVAGSPYQESSMTIAILLEK